MAGAVPGAELVVMDGAPQDPWRQFSPCSDLVC